MSVGVVVVAYNARDIILDCVESLLASHDADVRIVVVNNYSTDDTSQVLHAWAKDPKVWAATAKPSVFESVAHGPITLTTSVPVAGGGEVALVETSENLGFAGGVNVGLRLLRDDPEINNFWVLNPDCVAENATAAKLLAYGAKAGKFGVIGGRIFYKEPALMIQSDGGRINFSTGICSPFNLSKVGRDVPGPQEDQLDYIAGAHMFVSRDFLDIAGLMPEEYFLFYEEMDWCCRRGDLPLLFCTDAAVHHDGGHTIGSATMANGPSALATYFTGRSRMMFIRRYKPVAVPLTFIYSFAKAGKYMLKGQFGSAFGLLRGICGFRPSKAVRARLRLSQGK
ncbi:MAG: glycosyltransferase family 2 protein [Rhodobacteraceae bacterium]|nr:glycosyltransferase family 2 protein [Paracoccaceae bacterium]